MALRLSIPARVFLGFATILAAFGMVTLFGLFRLHELDKGLVLVSQGYQKLTRMTAQLESSYRNSEQATARLLDERDVRARDALLAHAVEFQPKIAREKVDAARGLIDRLRQGQQSGGETAFLDRVDGLLASVSARYDAYGLSGRNVQRLIQEAAALKGEARAASEASLDVEVRRLKGIEQGIGAGIKDLSNELETRIDQRVKRIAEDERQAALMVLVFSVLATLVGLFVTVMSQRTLAPIRRMTEAVKDVGEGRFTGDLPAGANDELGLLAREFNQMAHRLAERDRQLAEKTQELLRSERLAAVGRLAAQITHEIRNPLSSLSLNAELLQEQIDSGRVDLDEARALVRSMVREMDRLAEVTEEYLRFSRWPKPLIAAVDLNDAVDELAAFVGPELTAAGIELRVEPTPAQTVVRADGAQLRQVLLNLVRNAREAMNGPGTLKLVTRRAADGRAAEVEVADTGPGIADDLKARIFEPFFTTKERGTGLGLALAQQIAHEHSGSLRCDSAPGQGTRMIFALPLDVAETSEGA